MKDYPLFPSWKPQVGLMETLILNVMKNIEKPKRNINISTKVTFEEKIDIQRIANEHNISPYELIYTLVMNFKDHYQYIGQKSPKEEKLLNVLEEEKKKNRKLNIALENAEHRIQIEQELSKNRQKEIFEQNNQLNKLKEDLKIKNKELKKLLDLKHQLDLQLNNENKNDKGIYYASLGSIILTGISLLLLPFMFKK